MNGDSRDTRPQLDWCLVKELMDGFVHEVKNPLAGIRVALKALGKQMATEDPNRKVIEQIHERVGSINKALSDLMEFSRISAPKLSMIDVNMALEQSLERVQSKCQRREITIEKHLSGSLPQVNIDPKQTEQAFLCILSDMLEATPDGGKLVVRSSMDTGGHIVVELEDTGTSIQENHLNRLFKPFLSTMGRGSGVGLSIAKTILGQNGGSIQAEKRDEGGLTFRIVFPVPAIEAGDR